MNNEMTPELLVRLKPEQRESWERCQEVSEWYPDMPQLLPAALLELAQAKQAWAALENFMPVSAEINALPEGIRHYVMVLETRADPAGDLAARRCSEITMGGLMNRLSELGEGFEND